VSSGHTQVVAVDDGEFELRLWSPEAAGGTGVLLLPEIFGVGPFIHAVAEKLAALGYVVASPDVFWRFHPGYTASHDEAGLAEAMSNVQQHLDFPLAVADCTAACDHLIRLSGVDGRPAVLGYSLGGALAWALAARDAPAACISYYAPRVPYLLDLVDEIRCPTLLHFGDSDRFIPAAGVEAVQAAVAGRPGFTVNVETAGHSFENHEAAMFYDEAAARSAWTQTVAFLAVHHPPNHPSE
jgi:carboxymethylenebutenolidase